MIASSSARCLTDFDLTIASRALRTVQRFYQEAVPPAPAKYDLETDGTVDIYDLAVVAANFGYNKPDTHP